MSQICFNSLVECNDTFIPCSEKAVKIQQRQLCNFPTIYSLKC